MWHSCDVFFLEKGGGLPCKTTNGCSTKTDEKIQKRETTTAEFKLDRDKFYSVLSFYLSFRSHFHFSFFVFQSFFLCLPATAHPILWSSPFSLSRHIYAAQTGPWKDSAEAYWPMHGSRMCWSTQRSDIWHPDKILSVQEALDEALQENPAIRQFPTAAFCPKSKKVFYFPFFLAYKKQMKDKSAWVSRVSWSRAFVPAVFLCPSFQPANGVHTTQCWCCCLSLSQRQLRVSVCVNNLSDDSGDDADADDESIEHQQQQHNDP